MEKLIFKKVILKKLKVFDHFSVFLNYGAEINGTFRINVHTHFYRLYLILRSALYGTLYLYTLHT